MMNRMKEVFAFCTFGIIPFFFVEDAAAEAYVVGPDIPVLDGISLKDRSTDEREQISFLIDEGVVTPQQALISLDEISRVEVIVISGPVEFLIPTRDGVSNRLKVEYRSDLVYMPPIKTGREGDDSLIEIRVDDELIGPAFRVGTMGGGDDLELLWKLPVMRPALLLLDEIRRYAIVDSSRMELGALEESNEIYQELRPDPPEEDLFVRIPGDGDGPLPDINHCPLDMWRNPRIGDRLPRSFCVFNVIPAGRFEWQGNGNPRNFGYSMKPESASALIWATAGLSVPIDGVYRTDWGCNRALKVPNFCIAKATVAAAGCCCSGVAIALGKNCSWIDPGTLSDWPNCPLGT